MSDWRAGPPGAYPPAAHRCSDAVRLHIVCGNVGRWVAIRLSDGGTDGVIYDTRAHAIAHQLHETQCAYVRVPPDDMSPAAAYSYLTTVRALYDAGIPLADPDRDVQMPVRRELLPRLATRPPAPRGG